MGSRQQRDNPHAEGEHDPSSHDQHHHLPFGLMAHETLVYDGGMPLGPAPGHDSLLNDSEQLYLQSFFDTLTSPGRNFGEGLHYSNEWMDYQEPPTVIGHQTHLSNTPMDTILQSIHPIGFEQLAHEFAPQFMPPHPAQLSPEILDAAQALSRQTLPPAHQHHPQPPHQHQHPHQHQQHFGIADGLPSHVPTTMGTPLGSVQSAPSFFPQEQTQQHISGPHPMHGNNGYHDMYHPVPSSLPVNPRAIQHATPEIHFGTDRSFAGGNFNPNSESNINERVFRQQQDILSCLEPSTSTAPSRAPSPQRNGDPKPGHGGVGAGSGGGAVVGAGHSGGAGSTSPLKLRTSGPTIPIFEDNGQQPPKKRRKSKPKANADEDDEVGELDNFENLARTPIARTARESPRPGGTIPRGGRPLESSPIDEPLSAVSSTPGGGGGTRRRRGNAAAAAAKPPRENLTEQQKRENHIKSEQKRRTLIKEGFEDVQELVPDLKGAGLSKSHMLVATADHLERILQGNAMLRKLLGPS